MLHLIKPKYFMPIHGEYAMLKSHINIAVEMGIPKENCFALNAGDVLAFNNEGPKVIKNGVYANDIYIDSSLSDVDSNMLKERKSLADEGFVSLIFTINKHKQFVASTNIITKGFADESTEEAQKTLNSIVFKAEEVFSNCINKSREIDIANDKNTVVQLMRQYIYEITEKRPVILPVINVIKQK